MKVGITPKGLVVAGALLAFAWIIQADFNHGTRQEFFHHFLHGHIHGVLPDSPRHDVGVSSPAVSHLNVALKDRTGILPFR